MTATTTTNNTTTSSNNTNNNTTNKKLSSEEERVRKLWETAPKSLAEVDKAWVFQHQQDRDLREFPTFDASELISGPRLGQGGFSNVFEIEQIKLRLNVVDDQDNTNGNGHENGHSVNGGNANANGSKDVIEAKTATTTATKPKPTVRISTSLPSTGATTSATTSSTADASAANNNNNNNANPHHPLDSQLDHDDQNKHYDISNARTIMAQRCMRFGVARYAIKRLRPDLTNMEYARGALDLAIEIKFMTVLNHSNIVKMRGYSNTSKRLSVDTFIVMDRLYDTLEDRMEKWAQQHAMLQAETSGCLCFGGTSQQVKVAQRQLLKERLLVAYDLTRAFDYLHSLRLLYRDIKPENIGFDVRNDVKIFDFGLAKSVDEHLKSKTGTYGYNLTGFTGSIPYMAPEIALKQPYDKECDVFSFSMLLWEMAAFQFMYPNYSIKDYYVKVCKNNERPAIPCPSHGNAISWPAILRSIITEGWNPNPQKRPTMKRIGMLLKGLLHDMSDDENDDEVSNRSQRLMNRSRRSLHAGKQLGNSNDSTHSTSLQGIGGGGISRSGSSRHGGRTTMTMTTSTSSSRKPNTNTNSTTTIKPVLVRPAKGQSRRSIHDGHESMDG